MPEQSQPKLHPSWSWWHVALLAVVCLVGWATVPLLPFLWAVIWALIWLIFSIITITAARRLRQRDQASR